MHYSLSSENISHILYYIQYSTTGLDDRIFFKSSTYCAFDATVYFFPSSSFPNPFALEHRRTPLPYAAHVFVLSSYDPQIESCTCTLNELTNIPCNRAELIFFVLKLAHNERSCESQLCTLLLSSTTSSD